MFQCLCLQLQWPWILTSGLLCPWMFEVDVGWNFVLFPCDKRQVFFTRLTSWTLFFKDCYILSCIIKYFNQWGSLATAPDSWVCLHRPGDIMQLLNTEDCHGYFVWHVFLHYFCLYVSSCVFLFFFSPQQCMEYAVVWVCSVLDNDLSPLDSVWIISPIHGRGCSVGVFCCW